MQEVKRLGILSVAKILALFGFVLGLFVGVLFTLMSEFAGGETIQALTGTGVIIGWKSLIILPLFYAVMYFISGFIGAAFYNLFASLIGGIKVDLGKSKK